MRAGASKEAIVAWERASFELEEPDLRGFAGGIGVLVAGVDGRRKVPLRSENGLPG